MAFIGIGQDGKVAGAVPLEQILALGDITGTSSGIFFSDGDSATFSSSSPISWSSTTNPLGPRDVYIERASAGFIDINTTQGGSGDGTLRAGEITVPAVGFNTEKFGAGASVGGTYGLAVGNNASISGDNGVAIGASADCYANQGTAVGHVAVANTRATAVGYFAAAAGVQAISIGAFSDATGQDSIACGESAQATAVSAIAIGPDTACSANYGIALGGAATSSALIAEAPQETQSLVTVLAPREQSLAKALSLGLLRV